MKKNVCVSLCLSLVIICIIIPANIANASTGSIIPLGNTAGWESPFVTPISGDKDFTVQTLDPITLLAGTSKTESGLVVPIGFSLGEKQFGGEVLQIKGFEAGTARACFYFPNHRYGWSGGIYQWNGNRWIVIPSTLSEGSEGAPAVICADVFMSGTYALIIGYTQPIAKNNVLPPCSEDVETIFFFKQMAIEDDSLFSFSVFGLAISGSFPEGTPIRYTILDISPAGSMSGALKGTGKVIPAGPWTWVIFLTDEDLPDFWDMPVPPEYTRVTMTNHPDTSFTFRLITPKCYLDYDKDYILSHIVE